RRTEQWDRLADSGGFRDAAVDRFIDELLSAADSAELLVGVHQVAGEALRTAYHHHSEDTAPEAAAPTVRARRRILRDYEPMLTWAGGAVAAFEDGGVD